MSQRSSQQERQPLDQYMTPEWVVDMLLEREHVAGPVWEPACGTGAIARGLRRAVAARLITATDIDPAYCKEGARGVDFLNVSSLPWIPEGRARWTIITNPPYGRGGRLARAFVEHALAMTQEQRGRVIMLLPNDWDAAGGRQNLFANFPGRITKYILCDRIRWTNLPQTKNGPSQNHAWFVWDHAGRGRHIDWLKRPPVRNAEAKASEVETRSTAVRSRKAAGAGLRVGDAGPAQDRQQTSDLGVTAGETAPHSPEAA